MNNKDNRTKRSQRNRPLRRPSRQQARSLQDILSLGYEAEKSELILRHFAHDFDELMEALICGYEVEKTPEEKVRDYYKETDSRKTIGG
jgi:DNA integrity scanning protein DisA with diadenylate cyclase activity